MSAGTASATRCPTPAAGRCRTTLPPRASRPLWASSSAAIPRACLAAPQGSTVVLWQKGGAMGPLGGAQRTAFLVACFLASLAFLWACMQGRKTTPQNPAVEAEQPRVAYDTRVERYADSLLNEGREVFRYDSFGSEDFWGGKLRLHEAVAGEREGGVGPGLTPK